MESTTQQNSSPMPYTSQETWRMECEAREWIKRFNQMKADHGLKTAAGWWGRTISNIEKIRGKEAADKLRRKMNELRSVHR